MKVVLAGASGFLGQPLAERLRSAGHTVTVLVRHPVQQPGQAQWDPAAGVLDADDLAGADAVVCLSGVGVGDKRWTPAYKREILDSRVDSTGLIARRLAEIDDARRPSTFISASAIGYYGERGDQPLPESAAAGTGFFAGVVTAWEAAAEPAASAGVRTVQLRTGLVLSASGGALKRQLPLFKFGLGGKLGDGHQFWSWITQADELNAIEYLLTATDLSGPVNLVAPEPVRNDTFTAVLGELTHRPTLVPAPAFALRLVLGEFADEGVLPSQRVIPEKLTASSFEFEHPDLKSGLQWALAH